MKHKHYECIVAWAEGKEIQFKTHNKEKWEDLKNLQPTWTLHWDYRIKPKTIKFRNALLWNACANKYVLVCIQKKYEHIYHKSFAEWVGDWQEVEIP